VTVDGEDAPSALVIHYPSLSTIPFTIHYPLSLVARYGQLLTGVAPPKVRPDPVTLVTVVS
jgi:hypothetical protein